MKKKVNSIFLLIISISLHAQNWDSFYEVSEGENYTEKSYKVIKDSNVYDSNGRIINHVSADVLFKSSKIASVQDESVEPFDVFEYFIGYENGWISTDNIVLSDFEGLPDSMVTYNKDRQEKRWIPAWYNQLLTSNKRIEDFSDIYESFGLKDKEAFSLIDTHNVIINQNFLIFHSILGLYYFFPIKKIDQKKSVYYVYCEIGEDQQSGYYNCKKILSRDSFCNLPDFTENRNCIFIIEQNGNRLRLYNGKDFKLIIELMKTDSAWCNSMVAYIDSNYKTKHSNLKPIEENLKHTWAELKNGLSETSACVSQVSINKIMKVSENLKLRSGEAISTQVLTVMSAGTKVKVLELGKEETIDGISSNWVKIEIQSGAKDKDGKSIKKGTVGWCYGGYLK